MIMSDSPWSSTKRPLTTARTTTTMIKTSTTPTTTTRMTTTTQRQVTVSTSRPIVVVRPTQKPQRPCQHGQYYAYPNSCTSFLICVNGNLVSQQCGPGLNWNKEKNMCDWAFKNPCPEKPHKNALLVEKDIDPTVSDRYV